MRRLFGKLMRACEEPHACQQSRARMSDYVDEELDAEGRERLEEHVKVCPPCRNMLTKFHLGPFSPWRG